MEIFISWSGPRSGAAAESLRNWLPKIVNAFKPWLSSADIDKGARWSSDISIRLAAAKAGIICLTPNNLNSSWILFESGALSKTLENTFVCPLLIGLEPADVVGPLAQFQATKATKGDILQLLKTLNSALRELALKDSHIEEVFEVWWPKLEAELAQLPPDGPMTRPHRTDRELIEELVDLARNQTRSGELSAALRLAEKRQATAFEVLKALNSVTSHSGGLRIGSQDFRYIGSREGKEFEIFVPGDIPLEEVEVYVKPQIASLFPQPGNALRKATKKRRPTKKD